LNDLLPVWFWYGTAAVSTAASAQRLGCLLANAATSTPSSWWTEEQLKYG